MIIFKQTTQDFGRDPQHLAVQEVDVIVLFPTIVNPTGFRFAKKEIDYRHIPKAGKPIYSKGHLFIVNQGDKAVEILGVTLEIPLEVLAAERARCCR